jgi:hypothetical protein
MEAIELLKAAYVIGLVIPFVSVLLCALYKLLD